MLTFTDDPPRAIGPQSVTPAPSAPRAQPGQVNRAELPQLDALLPPDMARRAELIGVRKAHLPIVRTAASGVLAGAFIALGAVFSTTVVAGAEPLPYGVRQLLAGVTFTLGLTLERAHVRAPLAVRRGILAGQLAGHQPHLIEWALECGVRRHTAQHRDSVVVPLASRSVAISSQSSGLPAHANSGGITPITSCDARSGSPRDRRGGRSGRRPATAVH